MLRKLKLLVLGLFFTGAMNAQFMTDSPIGIYKYEKEGKVYEFKYTLCLKEALDEFFSHNIMLGWIDVDNLSTLTGIMHTHMPPWARGNYGINLNSNGKHLILIGENVHHYTPTFISALVYHELYHQFYQNEGHCEGNFCPYILRAGEHIDIEEVIKNWGFLQKVEYFYYIRKKQRQ